MADNLPRDLTTVGSHQGNQPPEETGQTVSSPEGPDPSGTTARPAPALFQVVRAPDAERIEIQAHSARAEVAAPDDGTEIGQFRAAEPLRDALADVGVEGWTGVFQDDEAERVWTDDVTAHHSWIGHPRYSTVVLFADADAATEYADQLDSSA